MNEAFEAAIGPFSIRNPDATFDWIINPQEVKLGLLNCHSFIGPTSPTSWKTKVNLQNHLSLIQPPPSPTKKLIIRIKLKTSLVVVFDSWGDLLRSVPFRTV